ncbi:hypothetical protein PoB_002424200 [Plakobranchus ocellatus]|uniref:Uncharacterized protein n=1 Tax=Plakobranchus ocellatus TaxID=259542 RepID=A0AAV3ZSW7_9GAST|nr:hypothetical protein PoB_002424200 [Plakobranchus ocellatus]
MERQDCRSGDFPSVPEGQGCSNCEKMSQSINAPGIRRVIPVKDEDFVYIVGGRFRKRRYQGHNFLLQVFLQVHRLLALWQTLHTDMKDGFLVKKKSKFID